MGMLSLSRHTDSAHAQTIQAGQFSLNLEEGELQSTH